MTGPVGSFWTLSGSNIYYNSGNVGIGLSSPSTGLDVNGSIVATDCTISSNNANQTSFAIAHSGFSPTKYWRYDLGSPSNATVGPGNFGLYNSDYGNYVMSLNNNGRVGIGLTYNAIQYQLDLSTDEARKLSTTTWTTGSDRRVKQNIENADTMLCYNVVKNLNLKRYTWDEKYYPNVSDRNCIGFIAQEVKEIYPKAVSVTPFYRDIKTEDGKTIEQKLIFEDFHNLDVDQIYKCTYGAVKETINKIDSVISYEGNTGGNGNINVNKATVNTLIIGNGNTDIINNTGEIGEIKWTNQYLYINTENGWKKLSLTFFSE